MSASASEAQVLKTLLVPIFKAGVHMVLAGGLGILAIILPPLILRGVQKYDAPLFPLVKTGVEGFSLLTVAILILVGLLLGFTRPRRFWLWGLSTILPFPFFALAEMKADPTSHNLFPLEFAFYGMAVVPVLLGGWWGSRLRRKPGAGASGPSL